MVWGIHPTDYQNPSLLSYYACSHRLITHHQNGMIVYVDFSQVICYTTYGIVVFLTIPLFSILLLNNDERAAFSFNPIIHIFLSAINVRQRSAYSVGLLVVIVHLLNPYL